MSTAMVSLDTVGIYIMHVGVVCRPNRACVHILFNNINTIPGCAFDITSSLLRVGLWRPLSSPILPFQLLISPSSFSRHFVPYLGMPFRNLAGRAVGRVLTRPASWLRANFGRACGSPTEGAGLGSDGLADPLEDWPAGDASPC